ncbi:MAG: hypothetical protein NZM42_05325 [Gemmatales bacterium]|nr:hypothetical protein [Gemmatales bacterium]MDW8221876.1 hypothetical protein [Gemmatales bacterium]
MALLRWLIAATIFVGISLLSWQALYFQAQHKPAQASNPVAIRWHDLISPPPPSWVPNNWLVNLLHQAGLPDQPPDDLQAPLLSQYLATLRQALQSCPWIIHIDLQDSPRPHLLIQWTKAVPVFLMSYESQNGPTAWLAGENALWLTPISSTFSADRSDFLPVRVAGTSFPPPQALQPLPSSLVRAVRLALFLAPYRQRLHLSYLAINDHPVAKEIQLYIENGSQVLWETLDTASSISDAEKLHRLLEYVRVWHSLDKPAGPYCFDNRFPGPLLRKPLK